MRRAPLPLSDCEAVRATGVAQPVNTLTAGAFVGAGAWLWRRAAAAAAPAVARTYALSVASVGVGSVAYHAIGGQPARWLHDVTLTLPFVTIAAASGVAAARGGPRVAVSATVGGALAVVAVLAGAPQTATAVTGAVAGVAVLSTVVAPQGPQRWRTTAGGITALVVAAALPLQVWGRTGGPLCQPWLPAHGVWHVLAAAALAAAGTAVVEPLALAGVRR